MTARLRRPAAAFVLLVGTLLVLPFQSAVAAPVEGCSVTPKTDTALCWTYDLSVDKAGTTTQTRISQDPVDVTIAFSNTSTAFRDEVGQPRWLTQVSANLMTGGGRDLIVPSATLPDGLLLAGASTPCGTQQGNFAACTAGRGTGHAVMINKGLGCAVCDLTWGVQRIENERDNLGTKLVQLKVTLGVCVNRTLLGGGWKCETNAQTVSLGSIGDPQTLTLAAPAHTQASRTGIESGTLFLHGTSNLLAAGGTTDTTYTTARLPMKCGPADAGGSARAVNGTTVSVPRTYEVIRCAQLSVTQATRRLVYGSSGTIAGDLKFYDRDPQGGFITGPMVGEPVLLRSCPRTAVEPCSATPRETLTSAGEVDPGTFTFTITPTRNVRYFIEYPGFEDELTPLPGSYVVRDVDVAPKITRRVSRTTLPSGGTVTISGSVAPRHAGSTVNVQRLVAGVWKAIAKATLSSSSTYTKTVTLRGAHGSTARLRVALPAHSDHTKGFSPSVTLTFS